MGQRWTAGDPARERSDAWGDERGDERGITAPCRQVGLELHELLVLARVRWLVSTRQGEKEGEELSTEGRCVEPGWPVHAATGHAPQLIDHAVALSMWQLGRWCRWAGGTSFAARWHVSLADLQRHDTPWERHLAGWRPCRHWRAQPCSGHPHAGFGGRCAGPFSSLSHTLGSGVAASEGSLVLCCAWACKLFH